MPERSKPLVSDDFEWEAMIEGSTSVPGWKDVAAATILVPVAVVVSLAELVAKSLIEKITRRT